MAKKRPFRCFIHTQYGPPQPVDVLRFAAFNEDQKIVSALWRVFPSHNPRKPDFYVTVTGLVRAAKFSFHSDVLNWSWLAQAHAGLVERGIAHPDKRHMESLPIPALPWHGLTIRFVAEGLRKKGHDPDQYEGTIAAQYAPKPGHMLEVAFVLTRPPGVRLHGAQFIIGEIASGGRSLVVVGRYARHNPDDFNAAVDEALRKTPVPENVAAEIQPTDEFAAHMLGGDDGTIVVTELHNVRYKPPA